MKPSKAAAARSAFGRLGGSANTPAQNAARAANGARGGRPRRVCTACLEPVVGGGVHKDRALDATCRGRGWRWQARAEVLGV